MELPLIPIPIEHVKKLPSLKNNNQSILALTLIHSERSRHRQAVTLIHTQI